MPASAPAPFRGIFPIAPTPFTEAGEIDLDGQRRVLDCMIDQGVDGICILANYSEQFLLTDDERDMLVELCLAHVAGRVPVIVTCSHFSTQIAAAPARKAAAAGAAMLMMMPPYHGASLRADEKGILEHFAARRGRRAPADHGAGRAAVRCDALGAVSGSAGEGSPAGLLFQGRSRRRRGQAARPDRRRGRCHRRAVRRRGIDHADGRPRRGRDGHDAQRAASRPDQAGPGTASRGPAQRGRRHLCAHPAADQLREPPVRPARLQDGDDGGGVIKSDAVRHPLEPLHPPRAPGCWSSPPRSIRSLSWGR